MRLRTVLVITGLLTGALVNVLLNLVASGIQQHALGDQYTNRALGWLIGCSLVGLLFGYWISIRIESSKGTSPKGKPDSDRSSTIGELGALEGTEPDAPDSVFENTAFQAESTGAPLKFLFETEHFASTEVLSDMNNYNNRGLLAIDHGIALYCPPGFIALKPEDIKTEFFPDPGFPIILKNPNKAQLLRFGVRGRSGKIREYLRRRATLRAEGEFRTKLGVYQIDKPNPRIGKDLTLYVAPLSYWTIREFNRRLLEMPDRELQIMRRESLQQILTPGETIVFPCPSALYVEVSLVTKDRKLVILEKSSTLSALATRGLRWTCTVEEGLEWDQITAARKIDLPAAIMRGVDIELGIRSDQVLNMEFHAIALEHTHLNTAILGTMTLGMSSEELIPKIAKSEDFGRSYHFINIDSVLQKIFIEPPREDRYSWHPTGRMRALFTLYTTLGPHKVIRRLKSALD